MSSTEYHASGRDYTGDYVPHPNDPDEIVELFTPRLREAFDWADLALARDPRLDTVTILHAIRPHPAPDPGATHPSPQPADWQPGIGIATVWRARTTTCPAYALARVIDTVSRETFRDHGQRLPDEIRPGFLHVVDTMACWVRRDTCVRVATSAPPEDDLTLHARVTAEILQHAHAALRGSPYAVPDTAMIDHVSYRTWEITWTEPPPRPEAPTP